MCAKPMYYLESPSCDPRFNLALEQYVFERMSRAHQYFMLWQNHNTIVVGKHQNTFAEINQDYVRQHGVTVVRRLSGGGAVYHDRGNINFTFISDMQQAGDFAFDAFCQPLLRALDAFGVCAVRNGRNDMTIDGRKFSGNSQYARQGRRMHHGTLLYDSDLDAVEQALCVSAEKIRAKGVPSIRSRVTNIRPHMRQPVDTPQFLEKLRAFMVQAHDMQPYQLSADELAQVEAIQKARYDRWEWNFGRSPNYQLRKKRRFEGCGTVEVCMDLEGGCIRALAFYGDYFSNADPAELAHRLQGLALREDVLRQRLQELPMEKWFHGLAAEQLLGLLLQT